jgi:hypothetical protein
LSFFFWITDTISSHSLSSLYLHRTPQQSACQFPPNEHFWPVSLSPVALLKYRIFRFSCLCLTTTANGGKIDTAVPNTRVILAMQKMNGLYRKCPRHMLALLRAIGFWFLDAPLTVLGSHIYSTRKL